jgi:hypothetical protein
LWLIFAESTKDTKASAAVEKTYEPQLLTFGEAMAKAFKLDL